MTYDPRRSFIFRDIDIKNSLICSVEGSTWSCRHGPSTHRKTLTRTPETFHNLVKFVPRDYLRNGSPCSARRQPIWHVALLALLCVLHVSTRESAMPRPPTADVCVAPVRFLVDKVSLYCQYHTPQCCTKCHCTASITPHNAAHSFVYYRRCMSLVTGNAVKQHLTNKGTHLQFNFWLRIRVQLIFQSNTTCLFDGRDVFTLLPKVQLHVSAFQQ